MTRRGEHAGALGLARVLTAGEQARVNRRSPVMRSLTGGAVDPVVPRISEPCSCFIDLNADLMLFCKIYNWSLVDPNWVVPILLGS